ncbi:hypothetical protein BJ165DRAFT_743824 [Panaeolus papilionaceus]|nr:hypothetical protein BJ165DRAFT_743824 [Panaeolus papilionaceus]
MYLIVYHSVPLIITLPFLYYIHSLLQPKNRNITMNRIIAIYSAQSATIMSILAVIIKIHVVSYLTKVVQNALQNLGGGCGTTSQLQENQHRPLAHHITEYG